ncbi:hypothetical protein GH714_029721 [Hevea brasiliensis]|uniref:AT-hook motif nuclear-localized protein n=1 Tax=Hevea brasiliensis TaxID=3981 RepID=A0A6A6M4W1_HEVBR|nr:hypothetical protein GH714_029721 [Hevea brasiliensis]
MPQVMTINMNMAAENMSMERSLIATTTPPTTGIDGPYGGSGHPASGSELFANTAGGDFTPHVVTVNTGEDVAGKILAFAQKGPRGICILSANGAVSNVTIRQPGSSGGILIYEGRFEIISLSGSFTVTETGGLRSRTGGLSVSLASPDGRVIGCRIAGLLLAASPIQLHLPNEMKAHKRKHHRENAIGSGIPVEQSHEGADNSTSDQQISNAANPFTSCLNGSQHMNQRPSPDINMNEEDAHGT